jgi:nucleoside-diphosphate-sugar epimerase
VHVFVAGASGALGRPFVTRLIDAGYEVTGMTSSRPEVVDSLGATPAVANVLEPGEVARVIGAAKAEALVNLVTKIPHTAYPTPGQFKLNNKLRVKGTENLLRAAREAGIQRVLAESVTFGFHGRSEEKMKPLTDLGSFQPAIDALVSLERQTLDAGGIVLRYGYFYGPGTVWVDRMPQAIRRRAFFIPGKGTGWWSFIHVDDAADATVAALERGNPREIYNVCDDEPILAKDALRVVAETIGAKPPRHVPQLAPSSARHYFNRGTGASNYKVKTQIGWSPRYATFQEGFPATMAG